MLSFTSQVFILLAQSFVAIQIPNELLQELQRQTTKEAQECATNLHGMKLSYSFSNQYITFISFILLQHQ